jgi:predicted RNA-binding protein
MKVAIMQPYFIPYIGYFQLINSVDTFVIYDNIKYIKRGWINRNRILVNGKPDYITLPLKHDSDFLNVNERQWSFDGKKIYNKIHSNYRKAPFFEETMPVVNNIMDYYNRNLFGFICFSVLLLCDHLDIKTKIVESSNVSIDHSLKCTDKVLAICKELKADTYINAIRGKELYTKEQFSEQGIELKFIRNTHENTLSIVDVLMRNGKEKTKEILNECIYE